MTQNEVFVKISATLFGLAGTLFVILGLYQYGCYACRP